MARQNDEQNTVRRYLLRQLSDAEAASTELQILSDDNVFEELEIVEDELIDEYLAGELSEDERHSFETIFLANPERQRKLAAGQALQRYFAKVRPKPQPSAGALGRVRTEQGRLQREFPEVNPQPAPIPLPAPKPSSIDHLLRWLRSFFSTPLTAALATLVVAVFGFGTWRAVFFQSDVDKGLVALNSAYSERRPTEARISKFDYAPFVTTRGDQSERVNTLDRDRAERLLLDAARDRPGSATYHALGQLYLSKRNVDQAIDYLERAAKSDPDNAQIQADLGAALLEKGQIAETGSDRARAQQEFARSREHLDRALARDPKLLAALFNRALLSERQLLRLQAEKDWREYLTKDTDSQWAAEAREHLKRLEEQTSQGSRAREQLMQDFLGAFQSGDTTGAWAVLSRSRSRDGNAIVQSLLDEYLKLSDGDHPDEAAATLRRVFFAAELEQARAGDRFTSDVVRFYSGANPAARLGLIQARAQLKTARDLYRLNRMAQAVDIYKQARESFARLGDTAEALFAESWIGYCYLRIPRVEESISVFTRLAQEFEQRSYRSLLSQTLPAMGDGESSRGEFSRTLDYANRGLKTSQEIEDNALGVRCVGQALSIHLAVGDYPQALESLVAGIALADTISPDPMLSWQLYFQAAAAYDFLNFPASSLAFEEEARLLAEASKAPGLIARSWQRRGTLYAAQGKYEEAIRSGERALAEAHRIPGEVNVLARSHLILGNLQGQAGNPQPALAYYNQAIELYKNLDFHEYLYEAHKGRLLAQIALSNDAAADQELRTVLALFEQHRARITEESNRDKFFDAAQDTYDLAVDFAYSRMKDERRAFEYAEDSRARSLLEMMESGARIIDVGGRLDLGLAAGTKPLTLSEIQTRMPERAQILQYSVLRDKLILWLVTKHQLRSATVGIGESELEPLIREYVGSLAQVDNEAAAAQRDRAKKLYSLLIAPVANLLDQSRQLSIVADKSLNYLPLAALVSPEDKFLIEDYSLEMSPSATVFIYCSERATARAGRDDERLLSVGNPSFDAERFPELRDLPAAQREAKQVGSYYSSPVLLLGDEARAELIKKELPDFDVVHLATHAVADSRSPLLSKLLFTKEPAGDASSHHAGRSFLQASDIYQLALPRTRLVVLSACQTGVEQTYRGEGAIGFARPFMAAGVPLVVASFWPVDSEATAELMIGFHQNRRLKKLPTVEALRQAQLEMIHNSPAGKQNTNWAAFVAIGGYAAF